MISIQHSKQHVGHDARTANRLAKDTARPAKETFDSMLTLLESRSSDDERSASNLESTSISSLDSSAASKQVGNSGNQVLIPPAVFADTSATEAADRPDSIEGVDPTSAPQGLPIEALNERGLHDSVAAKPIASEISNLAATNSHSVLPDAQEATLAVLPSQGWMAPKLGLGLDESDSSKRSNANHSSTELDLQAAFQSIRSGVDTIANAMGPGISPDNRHSGLGGAAQVAMKSVTGIVDLLDLGASDSSLLERSQGLAVPGAAGKSHQASTTNPLNADAGDSGSPFASNAQPGVLTTLGVPASVMNPQQPVSQSPVAFANQNQNAQAMSAAVSWLASKQGGNATLDLTPPDLGQVRLELRVDSKGESASLVVHAASEAARASIEKALSQLHASFEATGMSLTVSVDTGASSGFGHSFGSQQSLLQSASNTVQTNLTGSVNRQPVAVRSVLASDAQAGLSLYV